MQEKILLTCKKSLAIAIDNFFSYPVVCDRRKKEELGHYTSCVCCPCLASPGIQKSSENVWACRFVGL